MFRYLMPDCQCLMLKKPLNALPFVGIYIPLKNTNFTLSELQRVENRHASDVLNMHLLTAHVAVKVYQALSKADQYALSGEDLSELQEYYTAVFGRSLSSALVDPDRYPVGDVSSPSDIFERLASVCEDLYLQGMGYAKRLAFRTDILPYDGPLCDYVDFLLPLLQGLTMLECLPKGPIYLLVDDAHWLSGTQTKVLNTWVSTRTSRKVSLKVSTQHNYDNYYTLTGGTIDTPHDFTEIDITTIYTGSRKSSYKNRIHDIVKKRLERSALESFAPETFFPVDEEQEEKIREFGEEHRKRHDQGKGRGHRRSDDAVRYARPDFIKSLAGDRKASSSYSYSGFDQLVHLSSGIVRFFIEPAHRMFAENQAKFPGEEIRSIPPDIQSSVARAEADRFLFDDIERLQRGSDENAPPPEDINKLSNLLHGLGGVFREVLLSDRSERRVFSIAISDSLDKEVASILDLGVQLGYFHKSTLGRKERRTGGRTRLFVLSKRLAPIWNLDPTGFAGYLFVTSSLLEEAIHRPRTLLRRILSDGLPRDLVPDQLELELTS